MDIVSIIVAFFINIGNILISPIKNTDMLWIIIPVYLNWIVTELYQEKKGTNTGNAITNGIVALWVGVDWTRTVVNIISDKLIKTASAVPRIVVSVIMISYGLMIVYLGIKGHKAVKIIGRIREVSYFTIMLTPIFYGIIKPTWGIILSILVMFPIMYGTVELILWFLPTPTIYEEEQPQPLYEPAIPDMPQLSVPDAAPNKQPNSPYKQNL